MEFGETRVTNQKHGGQWSSFHRDHLSSEVSTFQICFCRSPIGLLRPAVHAPTQRYNMKVRTGRGFTLEELRVSLRGATLLCRT